MNRLALTALALCLPLFALADTFDDIMAAHRKALTQAKVTGSQREKVDKIDEEFTKSMRSSLDELVKTPKSSPHRDALVTKMRKDTSDYKTELRKTLGTKWDAYQRAYGALMPSRSVGAARATEPSKSGSKKAGKKRNGLKEA